jgi:ribonuclease P/MRP protein subunit POP1
LNGPIDQLLEHLHKLTNKGCGLTFGAKAFLNGRREGSVMLYHQNAFPYGAIGRVNFLWKPAEVKSDDNVQEVNESRHLWIWVHPGFCQELLDELILLFNFVEVNSATDTELSKRTEELAAESSRRDTKMSDETVSSPAKKKCKLIEVNANKKDVEKTKLETRNIPFIRTPKYQSGTSSVRMILLKDTLNRFRLTGPLSQAVLLESLHVANILEVVSGKTKIDSKMEEDSLDMRTVCLQSSHASDDNRMMGGPGDWWTEFYGVSHHKDSWYYQEALWHTLKGAGSPAQLPPHLVLALTILDPRLQLPSKRTKAVPDKRGEVCC